MDQAAADLNNVAVAYLERGDLRMALDLFRAALRTTMGGAPVAAPPMPVPHHHQQHMQVDSEGSASSSNSNNHGGAQATTTTTTTTTTTPPEQQQPQQEEKPVEFNSAAFPFVHAQGFGVVGTPGAYSPDPLVNTTVISTIVIFNLAVVYHIKGIYEKAVTEARLLKAHSLYVKAHLLLQDAGVTFGSTGNAVVDLLSMAVSNNLAHVCFELSSYDESRSHFDGLIRFALTVIPGRYGDHYVGSVMDQQKSNFLLNAIILHAPNLAPAA